MFKFTDIYYVHEEEQPFYFKDIFFKFSKYVLDGDTIRTPFKIEFWPRETRTFGLNIFWIIAKFNFSNLKLLTRNFVHFYSKLIIIFYRLLYLI